MRGIGGTASDGGGKVVFTGQDPLVRSHFRIGASMAIPAMAAGVGAAGIWKERAGQGLDVSVDLREFIYNTQADSSTPTGSPAFKPRLSTELMRLAQRNEKSARRHVRIENPGWRPLQEFGCR